MRWMTLFTAMVLALGLSQVTHATTLSRLAEVDERAAHVVELRFFGSLSSKEVAHILGVSRRTVQEDWRMANMWLSNELTGGGGA